MLGAQNIKLANHVIASSHTQPPETDTQKLILASAYFACAYSQELSSEKHLFNLNCAVTLLENVQTKTPGWANCLAQVYFKRAQASEDHALFSASMQDYEKILTLLAEYEPDSDDTRLLVAQSAIAIAEMIINNLSPAKSKTFFNPHSISVQAINVLLSMKHFSDEVVNALSYAFYVSGSTIEASQPERAKKAFHTAIHLAFRSQPDFSGSLLSTIYLNLSNLNSQSNHKTNEMIIYYVLSLIFNDSSSMDNPEECFDFYSLLRFCDQLQTFKNTSLPESSFLDVIDALIFCLHLAENKHLPNLWLQESLSSKKSRNCLRKKIQALLKQQFNHSNPSGKLLSLGRPSSYNFFDALELYWQREPCTFYYPDFQNRYTLSTNIQKSEVQADCLVE